MSILRASIQYITLLKHLFLSIEQCSAGWEVRNRDHVDNGGRTMVSPNNPFNCTGTITEWQYRSKHNHPFKAIVWRPLNSTYNKFKIVGINEIPAGVKDENVVHVVPECERIEVRSGDVIG